jgi:hypothetical protein
VEQTGVDSCVTGYHDASFFLHETTSMHKNVVLPCLSIVSTSLRVKSGLSNYYRLVTSRLKSAKKICEHVVLAYVN